MRTKYFLLTLLFISLSFLSSCSKDNDESTAPEISKQVQRISAASTNDGTQNEYRFQYNEDNTIKSIVKISTLFSFSALFEYEQNSMSVKITPSVSDVVEMMVAFENDIITSIIVNDQDLPLTYNAVTKSYIILGNEITSKENGDVASFGDFVVFNYDQTQKGAFNSVSSNIHQLIFLLFEETYLSTALSTKPVKSVDTGLEFLDFSNTYDSQGFITSAISGSVSFEYQYFE